MIDRPIAQRKNPSIIGQIIAALDDRNLSRAMRVLDPERQNAELSSDPDQNDAPRCVNCATRGE